MLQIKKISADFFVLGIKLPTASLGRQNIPAGQELFMDISSAQREKGKKKATNYSEFTVIALMRQSPLECKHAQQYTKKQSKKSVLYRLFYKKVIKTIVQHTQLHKQAHHGRCLCESRTMNT